MRKLTSILLIICLLCTMSACGKKKDKDKEPGETTEEPQTTTITVAVPGSSEDAFYKLLETFKTEVETNSNNKLSVTLLTTTELKLDGKEYKGVVDGECDMAFLPREAFVEKSLWLEMFDAWFMFLNYEHYRQTFDDKVGDIMFKNIRTDQNIQVLGTLLEDVKVINVRSDASFYAIDDFDRLDLGVAPSEKAVALGHTLGANPIVIVEESMNRYLADQTINAYEDFFKNIRQDTTYEQTNSIIMSEHEVDFNFIAMNAEKWDGLTTEQKEIVNTAIVNLEKSYDEAVVAEIQEYTDFYLEYGLTIQKLNKVEFHEAFSELYRGNVELVNHWNMEYYERILKIAKKMIIDRGGIIE